MTGGWRKYHYEEFHGLVLTKYYLSYQVKVDELTGVCSLGEGRSVYRIAMGKSDVKDSMGCQDVEGGGECYN